MSDIRDHFNQLGQGHVFQFVDELDAASVERLEEQAQQIDLEELSHLVTNLIQTPDEGNSAIENELSPADFTPLPKNGGDTALWDEAREVGEAALRAGRIAAFTVAGGQGTRLGFDGPKGTFPVTPVTGKSLFQVFAEKILASSRFYGKPIPWLIMTSVINHEDTVAFFKENQFFGLPEDRVIFFSQGLMPAVDASGKILMADKGNIALSPDGHGGSLRALVRSGAIDQLESVGIDTISYFQVDNPLVRCIDPEFIGFHLMNESELSSKALPKAYPEEKVGVFCERNGQSVVIEYSDMPERLANELDENGEIRFRGGSIAIHMFDRKFVKRLGAGLDADASLPFHLAHKKVPFVDASGETVSPTEPNAYKFEMFVFDALPFAKNPVIIETAREEDFSPVKNAEGTDSPKTSADDQLRQFARWVHSTGAELSTDESGLPAVRFEVSPLFADNAERFAKSWDRESITEGTILEA